MVLSVVAMSAAFAGGAAAAENLDSDNYDVGPTYEHTEFDDGTDLWIGQEVRFDASETLRIYDDEPEDGDRVATLRVGSGGTTERLDTTELEAGTEYWISSDDGDWDGTTFFASEEQLDVNFDDNTVGEDAETAITFDSEEDEDFQRTSQYVNVTTDDLDADEIYNLFVDIEDGEAVNEDEDYHDDSDVATFELDTGAEITVDFDEVDVDTGDFELYFDNTDSLASDNASIEVTDEDVDRAFVDDAEGEQGEIINVTVELDQTDEGAISLGDADDGFLTAIEFEDDEGHDQITFTYNTHVANNVDVHGIGDYDNGAWEVHEDYEDDVTITEYENVMGDLGGEPLPVYEWELVIGESFTADGEDSEIVNDNDAAWMVVTDRTPPGAIESHTAPISYDIESMEDFEDATVTETDTFAYGDYAIGKVPDFGAEGAIDLIDRMADGADGEDVSDAMAQEGVYVEVSTEGGPVGDAPTWNSSGEDADHIPLNAIGFEDYDGDAIVEIDYEAANENYDNGSADHQFETGETYDVEFKIIAEESVYLDEDAMDDIVMEHEVTAEDPYVEWPAAAGEVDAMDDSEVVGLTNVAPGSEIDTRATAPGDFRYSETATAEDGEFVATYDFGDNQVGTEFDLSAVHAEQNDFNDSYVDHDDLEDEIESQLVEADDVPEPEEGLSIDVDYADLEEGESTDVTVTVDNHEDDEQTVTVDLTVGDLEFSEELTIAGEDSESMTESVDADDLGVGDHDVTATASSDDFDADYSGTLSVTEEDDDEDEPEDDEDDGQPGFGVAVALVALLAAAMLALRSQN